MKTTPSISPPCRQPLAMILCRWLLVGAWSAGGLAAMAQPAANEDPANVFFRPGAGSPAPAANTGTPADNLELRGVMTIGGTTSVVLFDTTTSQSFIATVGDTVKGVKVTSWQPGQKPSVMVEAGGQTRTIEMKKASIVPLAAAITPPQVPSATQPVVRPGGPIVNPSMSDDEVRQRMQRVAEEIRRRRAMRREMLENQGQPQVSSGQPQE